MKIQVLLSCMHNDDFSIIHKSGLDKVSTLVVNQCNAEHERTVTDGLHTMIYTPTRGLSVSRNIAIENASTDICLISDDDEEFIPELENTITKAYQDYPDADVIIFNVFNRSKKLGDKPRRLGKYELLRVSSWQISFRLASVKNRVFFDKNLGAGTGNGASEENKFLLDCHKAGLKIFYVPVPIASVAQTSSTWFNGYDKKFFFNRGKTTRYILGLPVSVFYAFHFLILKRKLYGKDISPLDAGKELFRGIFAKGINAKFD